MVNIDQYIPKIRRYLSKRDPQLASSPLCLDVIICTPFDYGLWHLCRHLALLLKGNGDITLLPSSSLKDENSLGCYTAVVEEAVVHLELGVPEPEPVGVADT
eukprot:TRINITY_DN9521_c0_g1_i5.p1 TRINITY_DN9521_c0_g1~~TRINITY_DN9521_c0_g1_i5.p1  ORF type:complete len:102 (+),score=11.31 TRINITY_DN9521_c0_g1_i5:68-373(+)